MRLASSPMFDTPKTHTGFAALAASVLLLTACSKAGPPGESQAAVRANDGEISIHQIQAVLQRQPQMAATARDDAMSEVLEVLIDQELAAQASKSNALDKSWDSTEDCDQYKHQPGCPKSEEHGGEV